MGRIKLFVIAIMIFAPPMAHVRNKKTLKKPVLMNRANSNAATKSAPQRETNHVHAKKLDVDELLKIKQLKDAGAITDADELIKLKKLHDAGILTNEEYQEQKAKLLR